MSAGLTVVICGGGNGAHALAGLAPTVSDFKEVYVLSTFPGEAEKFTAAAATQGGEIHVCRTKEGPGGQDVIVKGKPSKITEDPSVVAKADVVVFVVPAFAHKGYLEAIKPHIRTSGSKAPGGHVILGAMPGEGGFDIQAQHILGADIFNNITVFALETLPWAVRLSEYGKSVDILGTKYAVDMAVTPWNMGRATTSVIQKLVAHDHPKLTLVPSMLTITLSNMNQVLHPSITWGRYHKWDFVTPFDEPPLFYEGVDETTGVMLWKVSDEILEMKGFLEYKYKLDLTGLRHIKNWMLRSYSDDIGDQSSFHRMINTNKGYQGLVHPMIKTDDGKYMPNFGYRYMTEDIPVGLVVTKGIAELCEIETPNMDVLIRFGEKVMNKTFLSHGKVDGPDVCLTRAPQAFGIKTIEEFIDKLRY